MGSIGGLVAEPGALSFGILAGGNNAALYGLIETAATMVVLQELAIAHCPAGGVILW